MNVIHLHVSESPLGTGNRQEIHLDIGGRAEPIKIHYDIFGGKAGGTKALDGFVQAVIFYAMENGLPLRVHGDMTAAALYNLDDYQRAWAKWRPQRYKVVDITPDRIIDKARQPLQQAISAYSGGVDSNFSLIRNKAQRRKGGFDIRAALMIQGFDIGYSDDEGLRRLIYRCQPVLDEFEVDLKIVRTNSKLLRIQRWEDSHAAEIAACLHLFSGDYGTAVIGSSPPYEAMNLPWGSNPVTDHRLSGGDMTIVHDGAGFNRTEKIAMLTQFPQVIPSLKVCWEGPFADRNCGVCEKCVRTRLCFLAAGEYHPACFDDAFRLDMIKLWRPGDPAILSELRLVIEYATRHGTVKSWVPAAKRQLRYRTARSRIVQCLEAAGIKAPLRRALKWLRMTRRVPPRLAKDSSFVRPR